MLCLHCQKPIEVCITAKTFEWEKEKPCALKGYVHTETRSHYCDRTKEDGPVAEPKKQHTTFKV